MTNATVTESGGDPSRLRTPGRTRRLGRVALAAGLCWFLAVGGGCMNPSLLFDLAINLPGIEVRPELRAESKRPTLVVLQHGLWRSWGSLWRMERALEAHGYEVLNFSYPSTEAFIEDHAALLHRRLEERLAAREGPAPRLCFVGHSMGGLVVRTYLERPDARAADVCVFISTPHRGAILTDRRKDLFLFRLLMGDKAALQLSPSAALFDKLRLVPCDSVGVLYGGKGDAEGWNDDIPGDDDGTVGVDEAQLPEQTAAKRLHLGHTHISYAEDTILELLHFLRDGCFRPDEVEGTGSAAPAERDGSEGARR